MVVAGGQARRLGGVDKAMLPLAAGGMTLLQHAVDECLGAGARRVIVAGPRRPGIERVAEWVSDQSPDGGPAVGIASALPATSGEYVFITAGDQQVGRDHVAAVMSAAQGHEGAWAVRHVNVSVLESGNAQPLFACVRREVLSTLLAATGGQGQSPLRLLATRDMVAVPLTGIQDVDTWWDAAHLARQGGHVMTDVWLAQIAAELGVSADLPSAALLDLTRDVAHGVERKAAPLTTYLLGVAVGSGRLSADDAAAVVRDALHAWDETADRGR